MVSNSNGGTSASSLKKSSRLFFLGWKQMEWQHPMYRHYCYPPYVGDVYPHIVLGWQHSMYRHYCYPPYVGEVYLVIVGDVCVVNHPLDVCAPVVIVDLGKHIDFPEV